jgi:hypothetical protein
VGGRLGAGVAAGGLAVAALEFPDASAPVSSLAVGTAVAIAVMLLPRIAWLAAAAGLACWYLLPDAGTLDGAALVLGVGAAASVTMLPRAGLLWSVPVLAPLLAVAGMGPLFVAAAGFAASAWRRAGLAAAGFLWLALVEIARGENLLFGRPADATSHEDWAGSLTTAAKNALEPLVTSPALLPAAIWIAFAVALPVLVRGRSLTLDLLGAMVWTAGLIAAHQAAGGFLSEHGHEADARGLAAGALLGCLAAVAAAGSGLWQPRVHASPVPRMADSR